MALRTLRICGARPPPLAKAEIDQAAILDEPAGTAATVGSMDCPPPPVPDGASPCSGGNSTGTPRITTSDLLTQPSLPASLDASMEPTLPRTARRLSLTAAAGLVLVLAATGCGRSAAIPTAAPPTSVAPSATTPPASTAPTLTTPATVPSATPATATSPRTTTPPTAPPLPGVHFTTPQAAMRYLSAAYNRNDLPALKKVTTASARTALIAMREEATDLELISCSRRASGDYVCHFRHDYPRRLHRSGRGQATFLAAPADKPGWYMTVLIDCG
jgi:hypothetical protein